MTRKIIYPTPSLSDPTPHPKEEPKEKTPLLSGDDDADLSIMLNRSMTILQREIYQLYSESSKGKLSKESSQSLVNYVKLLNELESKERETLKELNEEQLEALLKQHK